MSMPRPWNVIPATMIGRPWGEGWDFPISEARVPQSIIGKTGRIQAGVMDWIVKGLPVKRKKYCPTATQKVQAAYIQNSILIVTTSHGPHLGTPYICIWDSMLTIDIQKVGKNSDSVGCDRDFLIVRGKRANRVAMMAQKHMKRTRSRITMMSPIVFKPRNRCGVCPRTNPMPPVDFLPVSLIRFEEAPV